MDEKKLREQIYWLNQAPGGKTALRALLALFGGSVGSAAAALWSECDQAEFNSAISRLLEDQKANLQRLAVEVARLIPDVNPSALAMILGEVLGTEAASALLTTEDARQAVVLNPFSLEELRPFVSCGWLELRPTHSSMLLGAGNTVGGTSRIRRDHTGTGTALS